MSSRLWLALTVSSLFCAACDEDSDAASASGAESDSASEPACVDDGSEVDARFTIDFGDYPIEPDAEDFGRERWADLECTLGESEQAGGRQTTTLDCLAEDQSYPVLLETPPTETFSALQGGQVFVSGYRWDDAFLPTGTDQWMTISDGEGALVFAGLEGSSDAHDLAPLAITEDWEHCGYDSEADDLDTPEMPFAIDFAIGEASLQLVGRGIGDLSSEGVTYEVRLGDAAVGLCCHEAESTREFIVQRVQPR